MCSNTTATIAASAQNVGVRSNTLAAFTFCNLLPPPPLCFPPRRCGYSRQNDVPTTQQKPQHCPANANTSFIVMFCRMSTTLRPGKGMEPNSIANVSSKPPASVLSPVKFSRERLGSLRYPYTHTSKYRLKNDEPRLQISLRSRNFHNDAPLPAFPCSTSTENPHSHSLLTCAILR